MAHSTHEGFSSSTARVLSSDTTEESKNSGTSQMSDTDASHHAKRLEECRTRQANFEEETHYLCNYLNKSNNMIIRKIGSTAALTEYKLSDVAVYGIVTQSNIAGFSTLYNAFVRSTSVKLFVHIIELCDLSPEYHGQLCKEGLKILRYFASNTSVISSSSQKSVKKSSYFLRIFDIFLVDCSQQALVLHDKFSFSLSMQHKIWDGKWNGTYRVSNFVLFIIKLMHFN